MKNIFSFFVLITFVITNVSFTQKKPTVVYPFEQSAQQLKSLSSNHKSMKVTSAIPTVSSLTSTDFDITSLSSSILTGGNRLVSTQNSDGGWGWPLSGASAVNTVGPIAIGLAQVYQQTGNVSQFTALTKAATLLLAKTNNFSPSDGYLAAMLDKVLGVTTYTSYVKNNFYDKLSAGTYNRSGLGSLYNTTGYIQLVRTSRANQGIPNLAAWDLGIGLVGAAACGASTVDWIVGVKAEINELDGNNYYDVVGLAGAIYGLAYVHENFDPTAGQHAPANNISDLANILVGYQIAGGGFTWNSNYVSSGNETNQETGYAILAILEVNRTLYLTNVLGAANYLMSVQLGTGGWDNYVGDTGGENNEITGEALWALSSITAKDMKMVAKNKLIPYLNDPDKKIRNAVKEAIKHIDKSLETELWVDLNHLSDKGEDVFHEEKDAVEELTDKKFAGQFKIDALAAIKFLVTADQKLAQIAINEVVCNGDHQCESDLQKANNEMAKASIAIGKANFVDAIERYKNAWEKVSNKNDHEDDEDGNDSLIDSGTKGNTLSETIIVPNDFQIAQNFPNPFNPSTVIKFGLPQSSFVTIKIYDMLGKEVRTLVNGERNSGFYNIQWNGDNDFGSKVSSGTYIYRIQAGSFIQTRKMILMK